MGKELENGRILPALKIWLKMFTSLTKYFIPMLLIFAVISFLGWIYATIYSKFGIDKVIISGVVMMTYYLNKSLVELKKLNKKL